MASQKVTVTNRLGLHARPAGVFAKECAKYPCDVEIEKDGKTVNAKSILGVLSACVKCGNEITLICKGEDEEHALKCLVEFLATGLPE